MTVTNDGSSPALDLAVGNSTQETLVPGNTRTFNMSIPLDSIVDRNLTKTFTVTYESPSGTRDAHVQP